MKILLSLSLLACASLANACAELDVSNAWIRMPAPNAKMLAAYMSVKNPSDQSILIQGLSSESFNAVEMHTTEVVNGVAKMRQLEMLEVKVGQEQALAPGGKHLMLMGPQRTFAEGDKVSIALTLCENKQQTVQFVVAKTAPSSSNTAQALHAQDSQEHKH
jgi:periplasmic copper chaperone A